MKMSNFNFAHKFDDTTTVSSVQEELVLMEKN